MDALRKFVAISPDLACIVGFDGYIKFLNDNWEATLGWTKEELLSRPYISFVHPDDLASTQQAVEKLYTTGTPSLEEGTIGYTNRYLTRDGSYRWLSWRGTMDVKEQVMFGTGRDISVLKERDLQLHETQRLARIGNWRFHVKQKTLWLSENISELFGFGQFLFHSLDDVLKVCHADSAKSFAQALDQAKKGMSFDIELQLVVAPHEARWIRALGHPNGENDHVTEIYGVFQDISSLKTSIRLHRQLWNIANNLPGVIYAARMSPDHHMSFDYMSPKILELVEVDDAHMPLNWEGMSRFIHPEDIESCVNLIWESARDLTTFRWEGRIITATGKTKWLTMQSTPEKHPDGAITWDGIILDISDRKRLELAVSEERLRAISHAKLASIGEMAGGIAHEVNNPLTVILGKALLALRDLKADVLDKKVLTERMEKIVEVAERINRIVKGMLSLSRDDGEDPPAALRVKTLIEETTLLCQARLRSHGIDFRISPVDDELYVVTHGTQLAQTLINLINNAFDAIRDQKERWIALRVYRLEQYICIEVSDSGPGVSKEYQNRIMEPFFTTKPAGTGTGLGLSIAKRFVEAHHGRLEYVANAPHTTFAIFLPAYNKEEPLVIDS